MAGNMEGMSQMQCPGKREGTGQSAPPKADSGRDRGAGLYGTSGHGAAPDGTEPPAGIGAGLTATVMFCGIEGFSRIPDDFSPDLLMLLLNEHHAAMTSALFEHEGALDQCRGDELIAVFGGMSSMEEDALRCVRAAVTMAARNHELNALRRKKGLPVFGLGLGICTGEVVVGHIGASAFRKMTVVGETVAVARRLCSLAMPGQILAAEATYRLVASRVRGKAAGSLTRRPDTNPIKAYAIDGVLEVKMLVCR